MSTDMEQRLTRAEWEIKTLKEAQERQDSRMTQLAERLDVHHQQIMSAIGSLRDDKVRREGRAEAQLAQAQRTRDRLKLVSVALAFAGFLAAVGWIGGSPEPTIEIPAFMVPEELRGNATAG